MSDRWIVGGQVLQPNGRVLRADVGIDAERGEIDTVDVDPSIERTGEDTIDASGGLVIPGLVNAHTHAAMTLLRGHADDKPLQPWLEEDIWPVEANLTRDDIAAGARLGMLEMIKSGTVAFCDMYFHMDAVAEAVIDAGMRALLGHGMIGLGKDDDGWTAELDAARSLIETYDGAGDGRVRTAVMPHAIRTVDPTKLEDALDLATTYEVPLHFHTSETVDDVDAVVDRDEGRPIEIAAESGMLGPDAFGAHGVHVADREIDLLAETATGIAHCPTANMKLASGAAPVHDMLEAGCRVGIGTDGPASNNDLDMLEELRQAALLGKLQSTDARAVDAETAIDMATSGSSSLLGLDATGIEAGARADIAVVDITEAKFHPQHDLLSHLVYVANGGDVRHTICDGRVLMRDRHVTVFDEAAVRRQASERAMALLARTE